MTYSRGDEITFHNGDEILTGWIEDDVPVYDQEENIVGYVVSCPEFQGIVRTVNIIDNKEN